MSIYLSSLDSRCSYLKDRFARFEYKLNDECSFEENSELIQRGWRRFGYTFLRPVCKDCSECLSLRIVAGDFLQNLSKANKRICTKNKDTKILLTKPSFSQEKLYLWHKYHSYMRQKRGWEEENMTYRTYVNSYVSCAYDFGFELNFYIDERLVCVDYFDLCSDGLSSIYCFYDHDYEKYSLGKFSLITELKLAHRENLKYVYLGYFVKNCQSLSYKADFKPNEILKGTSYLFDKKPIWRKNASDSNPREH